MSERRVDSSQPNMSKPQGTASIPPLDLAVASLTDTGRSRSHNEDYVSYYLPPDPRQQARKGTIYLVADGMGGHNAGEVASQGAVELVIGQYYSDTTHDIPTSLMRAFHAANQQIYRWAQADPARSGMATTLVAAVILQRQVFIASVGDSRAYLIRNSQIAQITRDHSWVEEQVQAGLITADQARRHPQRNVVTRALGAKPSVEVDLFEGEIAEGDLLVLCTDGLTSHIEDAEIAAIVQQRPPVEAAQWLVAQANERGGSDNISVLIISARKAVPASVTVAAPSKPIRAARLIPVLVGIAAVLVGVAALLAGMGIMHKKSAATATAQVLAQLIASPTEPSISPSLPLTTTTSPPAGTAISLIGAEAAPPSGPPTPTLAPIPTPTAPPPLPGPP
ncbi:MAG: Stp1/IreP family PP2C-type Ser/Thr phosphatase, partial [Anaerolineae bacterium]